jgi:hypothetical protein
MIFKKSLIGRKGENPKGNRFSRVSRNASPLLNDFILQESLANYFTANEGGQHAVREVCELIIGLSGNYSETVTHRLEFSSEYQTYLTSRQAVDTLLFAAGVKINNPVISAWLRSAMSISISYK